MLRKAAQVSDLCNSKYQPPRDGIQKELNLFSDLQQQKEAPSFGAFLREK